MRQRFSLQSGFSLIEVIVVGGIAVLLTTMIYAFFNSSQAQMTRSVKRLELQQAADLLQQSLQQLAMENGYATDATEWNHTTGQPGYPYNNHRILTTSRTVNNLRLFRSTAPGSETSKDLTVINHYLHERSGVEASFKALKVGLDDIYLTSTEPFKLLPGRRTFLFAPGSIALSSNVADTMPFAPITFYCPSIAD